MNSELIPCGLATGSLQSYFKNDKKIQREIFSLKKIVNEYKWKLSSCLLRAERLSDGAK
jgi:hypothetical protein